MRAQYEREPTASTLRDLRSYAQVEDARAKARVSDREEVLGRRLTTAEKYEAYGDAPPLAVSDDTGRLLYVLARARRPRLAVEFGASHGISTIHLAAAIRDVGSGKLVTTELRPAKAAATERNLAAARLGHLVEVFSGDALQTLQAIEDPVDLFFLDGRNDFYFPVLRLLEPRLSGGAIVVADLSLDDPDLVPYLNYVRADETPYVSTCVPIDAGIEISIYQES